MEKETSNTPPTQATDLDADAGDDMDDMVDGDRQLTTDSDALDGGLNDSDFGTPRDRNGIMEDEESDTDNAGPAMI